ncbi:hypothetical protein EAY39_08145 [Vibrio anguillarum]|uniref:hypothetical protein n=1 Tax=Vibrio anguillarum TaxID=55601 RepID=UPI0018C2BCE8|nr:hypothetical protein [Vibrio anguillarum]MBF4340759.1 hypothetical protein [Vibrio anguillarum]
MNFNIEAIIAFSIWIAFIWILGGLLTQITISVFCWQCRMLGYEVYPKTNYRQALLKGWLMWFELISFKK